MTPYTDRTNKMKTIDDVIQKLEYIMESDPRTFSNPECEYDWVFHRINEAIKMLKEIEKDLPSAQSETCAYWDRESNICALHRPSAQPVLTCKGCKYDYYECVQCRNCLRKERDLYEPE